MENRQINKKFIISKDEVIPTAQRMKDDGRMLLLIHGHREEDGTPRLHGRAKQRGEELQILLDSQILIERELARHVAYTAAHLAHLAEDIEAVYRCRARLWQ